MGTTPASNTTHSVVRGQSRYHVPLFFGLFGLFILLSYYTLKPFLSLIIFSLIVGLIVWPLYAWFKQRIPKPAWVSTALAVTISLFFVLLPLIIVILLSLSQLVAFLQTINPIDLASQSDTVIVSVNHGLETLPFVHYRLTQDQLDSTMVSLLKPALDITLNSAVAISSGSIAFFGQLALFVIILIYLLPQLPHLHKVVIQSSPLSSQVTEKYLRRSKAMIFDTLKGSFVLSTVQALLAIVLFVALGVPAPLTFTFLLWLAALLPAFGAGIVMIPMAIVYLLLGNWPYALTLTLVQILIFGNIDNILRPKLVSKEANLNPVLMLLAVIGGLKAFGAMGLIYGPLILILLVITLDVYRNEYR